MTEIQLKDQDLPENLPAKNWTPRGVRIDLSIDQLDDLKESRVHYRDDIAQPFILYRDMLAHRLLLTAEKLSDTEVHMVAQVLKHADKFIFRYKEFDWQDNCELASIFARHLRAAQSAESVIKNNIGGVTLAEIYFKYLFEHRNTDLMQHLLNWAFQLMTNDVCLIEPVFTKLLVPVH